MFNLALNEKKIEIYIFSFYYIVFFFFQLCILEFIPFQKNVLAFKTDRSWFNYNLTKLSKTSEIKGMIVYFLRVPLKDNL